MFDENCFFSSGAPATRQSGVRDPGPRWAGGLQPRATAARPPTAPGQSSSGWLLVATFIYSRYMFSLHFRVCRFKKRYPGAGGPRASLTHGRSPPAHRGPGSRAPGFPLPTGSRGRTRRSRAWPEPPAEKTIFVKHQPKLYPVDV